jgi:hypothetical protein
MGALFFDMPIIVVYMDDIIVFGYLDFETHLVDVTEVLKRLSDAGRQVNPEKCCLFSSSVTYLGFLITREGIKPQPEKIQGILNMKPSNTKRSPLLCRHGKFLPGLVSEACRNSRPFN